jgi:hypothetical protein
MHTLRTVYPIRLDRLSSPVITRVVFPIRFFNQQDPLAFRADCGGEFVLVV